MIRAMITHGSFQNKNRKLLNEFSVEAKEFSNIILKRNWYPVADFLIRRYCKQSPQKLCDINSVEYPESVLSESSLELMKKVKKSSSIVVNIEAT